MGENPLLERRHLLVTCAVIERDGLVLAAQRSAAMSLPLKWEFPGGKIDPGESEEECLCREIMEELGVVIRPVKSLPSATYHYPTVAVTLHPYICTVLSGEIALHEHSDAVWLPPGELLTLDWAEADVPVVQSYLQVCQSPSPRALLP